MKSKPPLILMEQMVMVLVFALAAALCLQAFVRSDNMSLRSEQRDRALVQVQSAAETVRSCRGDMAEAARVLGATEYGVGSLTLSMDENWEPVDDNGCWTLRVLEEDSGLHGLGKAHVWVVDETRGTELVSLDIAWQEVSYGE